MRAGPTEGGLLQSGMEEPQPRNVTGCCAVPRRLDRLAIRVELQGSDADRRGLRQQRIERQQAYVGHAPWPDGFAPDAIAKARLALDHEHPEASPRQHAS